MKTFNVLLGQLHPQSPRREIFLKIVVIGLGYLGSTVAACAVSDGHDVIGVDPDQRRSTSISMGTSPVSEPELAELLQQGFADHRLSAQDSLGETIEKADIVIVCVATPRDSAGTLDMSQVVSATKAVGLALRRRPVTHAPLPLVYRSTLIPGTMDGLILPLLKETSGVDPGTLYEPCYNPESLREGSAVSDYRRPSRIIIGERRVGASRRLLGLYDSIDTKIFELSYTAAELAKLADNSFHALKIAFANELGRYATLLGIDAGLLADVFAADHKLNISSAYLRAGGAFGGPCLGKDTHALAQAMTERGVVAPLLSSIIPSNWAHHACLREEILHILPENSEVLIFGIGFKPGSADLRESPALALALELLAAGHRISIFDPDVSDVEDFCKRLPAQLEDCWVFDVEQTAARVYLVILCKPTSGFSAKTRIFDICRLRTVEVR
jgi:GDP-mannose 6-dehydrogenase